MYVVWCGVVCWQGLATVGITSSRPADELLRAGAVLAVPDMADPRLRAALAHMLDRT